MYVMFILPSVKADRDAAMPKTPEGVDTATEKRAQVSRFQFNVQSSLMSVATDLTPRQPAGHPVFQASHHY